MANLTLSLDEDRIRRAKALAAAEDASLSELLRRHIDTLISAQGQVAPPSLGRVVGLLRRNRARLEAEGVIHAVVFGSVARGEERPGSDVDVALDLAAEKDIFDLAGIAGILTELLGSRVDVAERSCLPDSVAAEAVDAF